MRTSAQKPKAVARTGSGKSATSHAVTLGRARKPGSSGRFKQTIGDQAAQPFVQSDGLERKSRLPRFAHDFARISVFAQQTEGWCGAGRARVGVGQIGAEPAPAATAGVEPAPQPPAEPAGGAEVPAAPAASAAPEGAPAQAGCVIQSRTAVRAPDGTADTRTTIGVCETVGFDVGGREADWTSSTGWPSARSGKAKFNWAAPGWPGTATITATDPRSGEACHADMHVVAPADVSLRKFSERPYPAGQAGAGMELTVGVRPRNVNFGWIAIKEDSGPASGVSGYFAARTAQQLRHNATLNFRRMGWNNTLARNAAGELQGDVAATVPGTLPQPWSAGSFEWIIPTRYRCMNSPGNGRIFTRVRQRFAIQANGTATVTKHGVSVTRSP